MNTIQRVMYLVCFGYAILVMYCCMFCDMPEANRLGLIISAGVMAVIGRMLSKELEE